MQVDLAAPAAGSTQPPVEFAVWKYALQPPFVFGAAPLWRWQPYQMQLPDGMSLASLWAVNRDGTVLAVGNAGTGDNHVLLLFPDPLEVTATKSGEWNPSATVGSSAGGNMTAPVPFGYEHTAKETYPATVFITNKCKGGSIWRDISFRETVTFDDGSTLVCRSQGPPGSNLMYTYAFGDDAPIGSKRLWNDSAHFDGVHSGTKDVPTPLFQLDYLRQSPLLH